MSETVEITPDFENPIDRHALQAAAALRVVEHLCRDLQPFILENLMKPIKEAEEHLGEILAANHNHLVRRGLR